MLENLYILYRQVSLNICVLVVIFTKISLSGGYSVAVK